MIVVIGHKGNARTQELMRAYWGKPMPNGMVMQIEPGDALAGAAIPPPGAAWRAASPPPISARPAPARNAITNAADLAEALTLPPQMRQQQQQVRATA